MFAAKTKEVLKYLGAQKDLIYNNCLNDKIEILTLVKVRVNKPWPAVKYEVTDITLPQLIGEDFSPGGSLSLCVFVSLGLFVCVSFSLLTVCWKVSFDSYDRWADYRGCCWWTLGLLFSSQGWCPLRHHFPSEEACHSLRKSLWLLSAKKNNLNI